MSYPSDPYGSSPGWQGGQQPGYPAQPPGGYAGPQPDNYLVWAILTTVLCCLPFGIISIVNSTKVSSLWAQGQYAEAQAASASAKKWAIIGAITGVVLTVVGTIVYFLFIAAVIASVPSTTYTTYSGY